MVESTISYVNGVPVCLRCQAREKSEVDIATAAESMRVILATIDSGELDASATSRARVEGGLLALEALLSPSE